MRWSHRRIERGEGQGKGEGVVPDHLVAGLQARCGEGASGGGGQGWGQRPTSSQKLPLKAFPPFDG